MDLSPLTLDATSAVLRGLRAAALCVAVGTLCGAACRRSEPEVERSQPSHAIARGDRVVVEQAAAQFFEGQVVSVQGDRLRVQTADGQESVSVAVGDVYRLRPAAQAHRAGDHAICNREAGRWVGCRVVSVKGPAVVASTVDGQQHQLRTDQVLVPTAVTALNLRRYFKRADRRSAFVRAVGRAGPPRAPRGWRPSPRERVLGYHDSAWYSASIHEIEDDGLRVRWQGDRRISELPFPHVVPEPPYEPAPKRGQYALARPGAPARPWEPVRVEGGGEDSRVIVNVEGQRRSVQARDLLPLRQ